MTAGIDHEAEYNNRARVPEHPALLEGHARDAAAFRAAMPPNAIPYGPTERQVIDLFTPPGHRGATVLFIHGGYWQALDRASFSHMAQGLTRRGVAVGVVGYDLCPAVRIGDIVEQVRAACLELARFGERLVVVGHSAGGHLAACLLATNWAALRSDIASPLVRAAFTISGLFELKPLLPTSINRALRLDDAEAERWSPLLWAPPAGLVLNAVVGAEESPEYHRQSRVLVERWGGAGVQTRFETVAGANHFTVIAPLADPRSPMVARIADLALGTTSPS